MGWFETALQMVTRTTMEVTVKNTVAQVTKEFFGFGPRTAVRCLVQGPLVVHLAPAIGSAILDELATRPAGRVVMQYNSNLLVEHYRERLSTLTRRALNSNLVAIFCDYDAAAQRIIGGALLDRPVGSPARPAPPTLTRAVQEAVTLAGGGTDLMVNAGPELFWTTLPSIGWVPPEAVSGDATAGDAAATLSALTSWRSWRDGLAEHLNTAFAAADLQLAASFVGLDRGEVVLGGLVAAGTNAAHKLN